MNRLSSACQIHCIEHNSKLWQICRSFCSFMHLSEIQSVLLYMPSTLPCTLRHDMHCTYIHLSPTLIMRFTSWYALYLNTPATHFHHALYVMVCIVLRYTCHPLCLALYGILVHKIHNIFINLQTCFQLITLNFNLHFPLMQNFNNNLQLLECLNEWQVI